MQYTGEMLLGIIQGVTEFLPISSSGHLIAARSVFGITTPDAIAFDVMVHVATLAAIAVYFHQDIRILLREALRWVIGAGGSSEHRAYIVAIAIGSIPAALAGFFLSDIIERVLRSPMVVVFTLLIGSVVFLYAERVRTYRAYIRPIDGVWIGLFQALALIPGMSRAGVTIAGGLFSGLSRVASARFSFLLGMPVIAGAGAQTAFITSPTALLDPGLLIGAFAAFLVGFSAIFLLMRFLRNHGLTTFVIYRVAVAILLFIFIL